MFRLALAGAAVVALAVTAFLYVHTRNAVIDELVADAHGGNAPAFAARVDWQDLRAFLKENLEEQKKTPAGQQSGPSLSEIGRVVDYYVQPANIDVLFYLREQLFAQVPERDFIKDVGYAFPYGFSVTVGWPKGIPSGDMPPALLEMLKARAVFRLDGLTWRIKELHVPLFIVPSQVYGEPATKVFGRPSR